MLDDLLRLLTLQDANTRVVLLGTTALGVASAVVGSFAVLRRRSLLGDAVSHAALPGICLAYLVVGERHFAAFLVGALVMGIAAAAFIAFVKAWTRVKEDAAIGLVIGGFFGLGIVLSRSIQNEPSGNRAGLDGFIFGKAASMITADAMLIGAVGAGVIAVIALLFKEFRLLCFDRDFASSQGWPSLWLDLLLMTLVCICTVAGLPAVGVVLMVSLLVIPAAAARFWTDRLGVMVCLAGAFGGAAGALGTGLSATMPAPASSLSRGWPTGPLITLVAASIFALSLLVAPRRGVVADAWRRWQLRRRVSRQNLLRGLYEMLEPHGDFAASWSPDALRQSRRSLHSALRSGLIERTDRGFALSASGRSAAARVVRAHRLWEIYLITHAHIAPDHVDRDADQIEHVLPPETLATLEAKLAAEGRLPAGVPRSPHRIGAPKSARAPNDGAGAR